MEVQKTTVKLGTDVKFQFTFADCKGNKMPVFSVYGVFVNKTLKNKLDKYAAKDNLHRYPHEPYFDYNANAYVLNQSGHAHYHAMPIQSFPKPMTPVLEYPATIRYSEATGVVDVLFLADTQREPGDYDLNLYVRTVDEGKFRENNIRKFSLGYESILTLT